MDIQTAIQKLAGEREPILKLCRVDSVDKDKRTADCTPLDDTAPLLACNLQANQIGEEGLVLFPKVGAFVLVGLMDDYDQGAVLMTDDLESLELKFEKHQVELNKDNFKLTNDSQTIEVTAEGIVFNGGEFGGLIKVEELTKKINAIEDDINKLKQAITSWQGQASTPVPPNSPSAGLVALASGLSPWAGQQIVKTKKADYENEKVKH